MAGMSRNISTIENKLETENNVRSPHLDKMKPHVYCYEEEVNRDDFSKGPCWEHRCVDLRPEMHWWRRKEGAPECV
jgi:hypothetical protein